MVDRRITIGVIRVVALISCIGITLICAYVLYHALTYDPRMSTALGSRLNPVPLNTNFTYSPQHHKGFDNSRFEGCTLKLTLMEVVKGEEANGIMDARKFHPMSPDDYYLLAHFKVEYQGAFFRSPIHVSYLNFQSTDSTGLNLYRESRGDYGPWFRVDLNPGDGADGWIVLEYAKTESSPMVVFDDDGKGYTGVWFNTT